MVDKQMELKKFFKLIYGNEIVTPGRFKDGQSVRITDFNNTEFINDVDDLVSVSLSRYKGRNTYFSLATTDGTSGQFQNLLKRTVIGLDFDNNKQPIGFTHETIIERFKKLGLWYHAIVHSGNGYHVYLAIEPTTNHDLVNDVTKAIARKLNTDPGAELKTQVLRVPFTVNAKDPKNKKPVNLVHVFDLGTVKRYKIEALAKRFITVKSEMSKEHATSTTLDNTNIPLCVHNIIKNGSQEGTRNADLQKIVVVLRQRNKILNEIMAVTKEWANKCKPVFDDRLEYQVEQIYDNLKYARLGCDSCQDKNQCKTVIESDFSFDGELITIAESQARSLKHNARKGVKDLTANGFMIMNILKNHSDGLTRAEITEELTYTNNKTKITTVALNEKTLKATLKKLKENGFIKASKEKTPIYMVHDPRTPIELTYKISYGATYEAIKGRISAEELRLYGYMRYLQHVEQRSNPKALKGNLMQITQRELAKDFGLTQGRISQMIDNLLSEKIISIWHRQKSKNNGFEFNIYRLNY